MQLESNKANFELIYEGPTNEEETTLRAIRAALVGELGLSVEEAQEVFTSVPSRVRIAESQSDLERDLSALLKAGSKARILMVAAAPEFGFELEENEEALTEDLASVQDALSQMELSQEKPSPATPEDFGLTLDLESDAGLPLVESGLQFAEEAEEIPSPLAEERNKVEKNEEAPAPVLFALDETTEEVSPQESPAPRQAVEEKPLPPSFSLDEENEVVQEHVGASAKNPENTEAATTGPHKADQAISSVKNIPLARVQKSDKPKVQEQAAAEEIASEAEEWEEEPAKAPWFFETRAGVALIIIFFTGIFIAGNFLYLASQQVETGSNFDPGLLNNIPTKSLSKKASSTQIKQAALPQYIPQDLQGTWEEAHAWSAQWKFRFLGSEPLSFSFTLEEEDSPELSKEEIVRGEKRKPWVHALELDGLKLAQEAQAWTAEGKAKTYIQDENKRYRLIVPAFLHMQHTEEGLWNVEFRIHAPDKETPEQGLHTTRDSKQDAALVGFFMKTQIRAPAAVPVEKKSKKKKG